ncbi:MULTISPECIES: universal stress protein [unclassified Dietzia]|uniref:universal stress protein n=1 Tax=unclassified Dietzia TaxID=2617939 RepID=UPI0015F8B674|nr:MULTISPECIES: universal stress protein [unclassified Dietzia]MBB1024990.1 universal stress protein [Dietzia sp. DQ12-76]MBB1027987.1 universal stress protein [Dietzia sp. DQ11-38-2]
MASLENSVIVGIDGSAASTGAVAYAAHTAATRRIPLVLVTSYTMPAAMFAEGMVPPQPVYDELEKECQPIVEQARATALKVAPDIEVSHAIVEGNPSQVLIDYSRKAKMVVLGSRGLGGIKGMVLGSVSASVASHAFCPVVVTREDTDDLDRTGPVVVGVDGSEVSAKATSWAFAEASARDTTLIAVHTWMDPQVQAAAAGIALTDDDWRQLEEQQLETLSERLAGFSDRYPDVRVERVVTRDRAVRALVEQAEDAQLVVVGSHGRGGFTGMVLGSTSRALLQASPCPVMVVRPESHS